VQEQQEATLPQMELAAARQQASQLQAELNRLKASMAAAASRGPASPQQPFDSARKPDPDALATLQNTIVALTEQLASANSRAGTSGDKLAHAIMEIGVLRQAAQAHAGERSKAHCLQLQLDAAQHQVQQRDEDLQHLRQHLAAATANTSARHEHLVAERHEALAKVDAATQQLESLQRELQESRASQAQAGAWQRRAEAAEAMCSELERASSASSSEAAAASSRAEEALARASSLTADCRAGARAASMRSAQEVEMLPAQLVASQKESTAAKHALHHRDLQLAAAQEQLKSAHARSEESAEKVLGDCDGMGTGRAAAGSKTSGERGDRVQQTTSGGKQSAAQQHAAAQQGSHGIEATTPRAASKVSVRLEGPEHHAAACDQADASSGALDSIAVDSDQTGNSSAYTSRQGALLKTRVALKERLSSMTQSVMPECHATTCTALVCRLTVNHHDLSSQRLLLEMLDGV
jgi:hypothetical protein